MKSIEQILSGFPENPVFQSSSDEVQEQKETIESQENRPKKIFILDDEEVEKDTVGVVSTLPELTALDPDLIAITEKKTRKLRRTR